MIGKIELWDAQTPNMKKKEAIYLKTYWYNQETEWNNNNNGEYKIVKKWTKK